MTVVGPTKTVGEKIHVGARISVVYIYNNKIKCIYSSSYISGLPAACEVINGGRGVCRCRDPKTRLGDRVYRVYLRSVAF